MLRLDAQSCLTLCNPTECSPPGSSVHGEFSRKEYWSGCHTLFQGISPTQELNPDLLHCRQILYQLSHQGSPIHKTGEISSKCQRKEPQSNSYAPDASNLLTDYYKVAMVRTPRSGFMLTAIIDCEEKSNATAHKSTYTSEPLENFWKK